MAKIKVKDPKPSAEQKAYLNKALKPLLDGAYELNSIIPMKLGFHALPSRSYIDYYKIIKKPQSLHKISQLIRLNRYNNAQEFVVDMVQITWNARYYNEIGSDYYESAVMLDNYIKDQVIPALKADPKIFLGNRVGYPYLGPLPNEEPPTFDNSDSAAQTPVEPVSLYKETPQPSSYSSTPLEMVTQHSPTPDQGFPALIKQAEVQRQYQQLQYENQVYAPIPTFSTLGIPASVFKDYEPIPVDKVPTLDQDTTMIPKPSPIILNTTTSLPPHPNQREVFESWNKRGKPPVIDKPHEQRIKNIMRVMKKHRSARGEPLYLTFERLPNQASYPLYYRKIQNPICLEIIRTRIKQRKYRDVETFLTDLFLMIENNKLYATQAPDPRLLNDTIEFENICKKLISEELTKPDSVYLSSDAHGMRIPIDFLELNGRTYKIGDWVLLRNPNDETKPIPAQIFRIWSTPEDGNKRYINVCWYYRPEQTVHRVDRLFYENEVFKTGQYRDHLIQDILGPCYVNYFTRYQRGEPAFKVFGPMFICEFRYSDHDKNFNKIRTWKACIPDEVREIDDPIIPLPNGGLRWFQKYTSPLMHLLPPNSTERDPIPEPIIASLNAPPLIGGVYKRGPLLDDDLGQYLSSPARNLVVRKTITLLNNIGTRNDTPLPSQQELLLQQRLSAQSNGDSNGPALAKPFTPQYNFAPPYGQAATLASQLASFYPPPVATHDLQAPAYTPGHDYTSEYQSAKYYNNSNTHYSQTFTGKIVPSPYSQVTHTFSNLYQSSSASTYILPNKLQKKLDENELLDNIFTNKMDLKNKERLLKFSPSFLVAEIQKYDALSKGKDSGSFTNGVKKGEEEVEYTSEDSEDDDEEEFKTARVNIAEPMSKRTRSLWFRGAPVYIRNRIVNASVLQTRHEHILRLGEGEPLPLIKRLKKISGNGVAKEEFKDSLPPSRRRVRKDVDLEEGKEEGEEGELEEVKNENEVIPVNGNGLFGFNHFGPSAEYMAFKLKSVN